MVLKNMELYITKINNFYKLIDRTFGIKNPPVDFPNLSELINHIKTTYGNDKMKMVYCGHKISCIYDKVWDGEREIIEKELKIIQS